jgi:hypothetical protein
MAYPQRAELYDKTYSIPAIAKIFNGTLGQPRRETGRSSIVPAAQVAEELSCPG